jgi:hypothetical protein
MWLAKGRERYSGGTSHDGYLHRASAFAAIAASLLGRLMARHFDQQATQRAAVILKIAADYSRDELNAALAAARRAFLYSLEEAGLDVDAGQAFFEALDVAVAFSQYRA